MTLTAVQLFSPPSEAQLLQFVFSGLTQGAVLALVALGFSMIYASMKLLNFAQGHYVVLGGLVTWWSTERLHIPIAVAVLLAGLVVAAVAVATRQFLLRYARNQSHLNAGMITLGTGLLIDAVILLQIGSDPVYVRSFLGDQPVRLLDATFARQGVWVIAMAALVMILLRVFYARTLIGQAMRACSMNAEAASLMGVNVGLMIALSWGLSGFIGGLGGATVAPLVGAGYGQGLFFALKGFTAATVGGLGSQNGAIVGGLVVGLLSALITGFADSQAADLVTFAILLILLVVRPRGLLGQIEVGVTAYEPLVT